MAYKVPDYYRATIRTASGQKVTLQVWDVIQAYKLDAPKGFAVKYILRAGKKDKNREIEDINKAIECLEREKQELFWRIKDEVEEEGKTE